MSVNAGGDFCFVRLDKELSSLASRFLFQLILQRQTDKHQKLELGPAIRETLKNVYTCCNYCSNLMALLRALKLRSKHTFVCSECSLNYLRLSFMFLKYKF